MVDLWMLSVKFTYNVRGGQKGFIYEGCSKSSTLSRSCQVGKKEEENSRKKK